MLNKKQTAQSMFKLLPVKYISKYVHCDMQFKVIKINTLPCFLNGFGIVVSVFSYYK